MVSTQIPSLSTRKFATHRILFDQKALRRRVARTRRRVLPLPEPDVVLLGARFSPILRSRRKRACPPVTPPPTACRLTLLYRHDPKAAFSSARSSAG